MSAHVLLNLLNELGKKLAIFLYDWRKSCLLIGPICLQTSLRLPENWSKLA